IQLGHREAALYKNIDAAARSLPLVGLTPAVAWPGLAVENRLRQAGIYTGPAHFRIELSGHGKHGVAHNFRLQPTQALAPQELVLGIDSCRRGIIRAGHLISVR